MTNELIHVDEMFDDQEPDNLVQYPTYDQLDINLRAIVSQDMKKHGWQDDEAIQNRLEYMLARPHMANLQPTGKYGAVRVSWLAGHLWNPHGNPRDKDFFGPKQADVMVVLSGPLRMDIDNGRYLSGSAGKLLKNAFLKHGVDLEDAYVTGACKFYDPYPNMNSIPAAWQKAGMWHLQQEILRVNPRYILVSGAKPLKFLLGNKAKLYSYQSAFTPYGNSLLMACNDIYGLLRDNDKMPGFTSSVRIFCGGMSGMIEEDTEHDYQYIWDAEKLKQVVADSMDAKVVAIDCEWEGETPKDPGSRLLTIQFSTKEKQSDVVVLWSNESQRGFAPSASVAVEILRPLFTKPGIRIIGQNFRADLEWLLHHGLDLTDAFAARGFDTMLAAHALSEGDDHDLMALTLRHTTMGRYDYEAQLLLDKGLRHADLPDAVLHPYAAADTDALMRIYPKLEQLLWDQHCEECARRGVDPYENVFSPAHAELTSKTYVPSLWNNFQFITMPVTAPIKEVEETGLLVDQERLEYMASAFCEKRDELLGELRQWIRDSDFNPSSSKQVADVLFGDPSINDGKVRLGHRPIKTSGKRGRGWDAVIKSKDVWWEEGKGWVSRFIAPSTDSESLGILASEYGCQFSAKLKDYRAIHKMTCSLLAEPYTDEVDGEDKYDKGIGASMQPDGRVRTHISQMSDTQRHRSFRPNAQNFPKAKEGVLSKVFQGVKMPSVRSIMIPKPGCIFVEADFCSAELFTLAYLSNDKAFKKALDFKDENGKAVSYHTIAMGRFFSLHKPNLTDAETLAWVKEVDAEMDSNSMEGKRLKALRTAGKSLSFGIPYGRGARAIWQLVEQMGVECTLEDAESWVQGYAEGFPDAWKYLMWAKEQVWNPGYLISPYGCIRHFSLVDDEAIMAAQERAALNHNIQSTVASALNLSLIRLHKERNLRNLSFRIALPIHDAILLEVPYEEIGEATRLLRWAMTEAPGAEVPGIGLRYDIDLSYETRWNEAADPEWLFDITKGDVNIRKGA